jgi:septal ring factor EnvC (AmiA/AmiB activator)
VENIIFHVVLLFLNIKGVRTFMARRSQWDEELDQVIAQVEDAKRRATQREQNLNREISQLNLRMGQLKEEEEIISKILGPDAASGEDPPAAASAAPPVAAPAAPPAAKAAPLPALPKSTTSDGD